MDEPAAAPGPPKLPKGYVMDHAQEQQQASGPPPPPTYMGEQLGAVGRVAKNLFYEFPKYAIQSAVPRSSEEAGLVANPAALVAKHMGQDLWQGVTQAGQASEKAKQQGEGAAGQTLAAMENYPVIGGMVRKAEEAGPGKIKLAPQTLGAATEAALTFEAPNLLHGAGEVANRIIPSTTRAGAGLSALTDSPEGKFAQHPAETPNTLATARKIQNELEVTGEKPHAIIQHYLTGEELRNVPPEIADQVRAQGIEPNAPMNLYEARTMLKRVNDVIRNSKGFNADAQAKTAVTNLKRFASALDEDINMNANRYGFGEDYRAMKSEYRHGKQIVRAGEEIGAPVGALAGYEVGRRLGEPLGGTLAGGMVGKAVGRATTGRAARALVERSSAGPPRLRSIPATPEAYTRTILAAKEGEISPGEADRRIVRAGGRVKVRPIPQPEEAEAQ